MEQSGSVPSLRPLRPVGLFYTPLVKRALSICFAAHRDQRDKGGLPYVFHPIHVAEQLETEAELCTALLHDVVEDSSWTLRDLEEAGFSPAVLEALALLTHDPAVPYLDYVAALRANPIARRVKLADLTHNTMTGRLDSVTSRDRERLLRYAMARAILEDDPWDGSCNAFRKTLPLSWEADRTLVLFYRQGGQLQSLQLRQGDLCLCTLTPAEAQALRLQLAPERTLPEALALWDFSR